MAIFSFNPVETVDHGNDPVDQNGPATSATPGSNPDFVNVVLRIDPNWPYLDRIPEGAPQKLFEEYVFVFVDQAEEGFSENVGVSYATTDVVGRDEQYMTYTGNANRTIPVTFRLMGQGEEDAESGSEETQTIFAIGGDNSIKPPSSASGGTGPSWEEVQKPARWIESLQHAIPDSKTGISYAPPPLILTIGTLFVARVILTDCNIRWEGPFDPGTMAPHGATVSCTFTVVRNAASVLDSYGKYTDAIPVYNQFVVLPTQGPTDTAGTQKDA